MKNMNFQKFVLVILWVTGPVLAWAQAADPLAQAKLDIWTETASFVYRDAKLTEPAGIGTAATMAQFVDAIKKDDSKSQIYSKLYRPIEETGTYKTGKDAKTQLDLLIKSINLKLRENEQRMGNIDRRQRLGDMYKQLQQIASDYTAPAGGNTAVAPIGDAPEDVGLPNDDATSNTAVSTQTVPETAEEDTLADNQLSSLSKKQNTTKSMDWMSTLALLLGIISLGLIYMLYGANKKLNQRLDQRKKEYEDLMFRLNGLERKGGGGSPDRGGKNNSADVESLVQKAVARELAKTTSGGTPAREASGQLVASSDERPIKMAKPVAPRVELTEAPAPEPVAATVPTPAPPAPAPPAPEKPQSFFARVPVNGGFHEQDLYPGQQHDSIYEIRISKNDPTKAGFRIVLNSNVHRTAIESAYLSLKDACNYQLNNQHATTIINDKPGALLLDNGFWKIEKKAEIHFE